MPSFRVLISATAALLLPSALARLALGLLGHRMARGARIGFSLVLAQRLQMASGSHIGHFNLINVRRLVLGAESSIGRANLLNGRISVLLAQRAALGNRNRVLRAPVPEVAHGPASLRIGHWSKITSDHKIDCTCSVRIGRYATVAGSGSQLWTHGYVHAQQGPARYRVDGPVHIGNNVYIGSACIVTTGVRIADGIIVGAGTTVARSLTAPGMYVSAGIRQVDRPAAPGSRADLQRIDDPRLCEAVYRKRVGG